MFNGDASEDDINGRAMTNPELGLKGEDDVFKDA